MDNSDLMMKSHFIDSRFKMVYLQLGGSNSQWHKKNLQKVSVGAFTSWGECHLGEGPVEGFASWGIVSKHLTLGRSVKKIGLSFSY